MVKNPPVMWETWVLSLDWEDPLEEGMATHSIFLPGESPWTEESGGLQSMGMQRVAHIKCTNTYVWYKVIKRHAEASLVVQ